MLRRFSYAVVGLPLVLQCGEVAAKTPPPDLVLLNGKFFTSDATVPHAEALAIRGDRIVAVGGTLKVEALAGPATRRIDLGGRTVISASMPSSAQGTRERGAVGSAQRADSCGALEPRD
jgi:hypothetical protein